MRPFACLWFELQMTQRYLREQTFARARVPANAANLDAPIDIGALRRASVQQVPGLESRYESRAGCSRCQSLSRLIGSGFGKPGSNLGKNGWGAETSSGQTDINRKLVSFLFKTVVYMAIAVFVQQAISSQLEDFSPNAPAMWVARVRVVRPEKLGAVTS